MGDHEDLDTDTKLAMLASLLSEPIPEESILLDALVRSGGIALDAANYITSGSPGTAAQSSKKKRKRPADLDEWIGRTTPRNTRSRPNSSSKNSKPSSSSLKPRSSSSVPSGSGNTESTVLSRPSSSPGKKTVNLMDVLRPPPSAGPSVPRLAPLTLSNPTMVKVHTPCTLHPSVLPAELACSLFYTMLDEARDWSRNKWWLFDRLVESPHRTSFYIRDSGGAKPEDLAWHQVVQFWYNGRETDPPRKFPQVMEKACAIIERVVNEEMRKRPRLPLEWGGHSSDRGAEEPIWRANFAASNLYEGAKETVGFHSDRLTSLGPYPTIASLSLGTPRTFRLRDVVPVDQRDERSARTYNIPLVHNSLVIMHATCQERFKHSIPPQTSLDRFHPSHPPPPSLPTLSYDPSNCRINITFRFYRPDFHPDTVPKCKCGIPTTLRPDMKMLQKAAPGQGNYRYWWACAAGDQNEGKSCGFWKVMDAEAEGRGPFAKDTMPDRLDKPSTS